MQIWMQRVYGAGLSLFFAMLLSACTTSSTTRTTPYTADRVTATQEANLKKAAATRLTLGIRYLNQGDYEKAKFNLDKALEQDPDSEDVHRGIAWYYEQVDEIAKARQHYQRALSLNPRNPDLLNQYGVFLCRQGDLEASLKMFDESASIPTNKDVSSAFENAATCSLNAGVTDTAEQFYRRALNHNPEKADSLLGMASIEYDKGRYPRSRAYIERYEKIGRNTPRSLWLALRTESKLGNMDEVASYALKLQNLFPDSNETAEYLDTRTQWLK